MNETVRLTVDLARELAWELAGHTAEEGWTVVRNALLDTSRWSSIHELVIRNEADEYYMTTFTQGLTECQDERPFEEDEPVFERVYPVKVPVTIIEYWPARDEAGGE